MTDTILQCSGAHLTVQEWAVLGEWADMEGMDAPGVAPFRTIRHGYGYFLACYETADDAADRREAREHGVGDGFFALLDYARGLGYRWVDIDSDGDVIGGLPT